MCFQFSVKSPVGRRHYRTSGGGAAETAHEAVKPQSAHQAAQPQRQDNSTFGEPTIREQETKALKTRQSFIAAILLLFTAASPTIAQEKLLTIDDIFDPAKRVNFNGTPANPRWLKDGVHYMVVSKDRNASPRLLKVDAVTGQSQHL